MMAASISMALGLGLNVSPGSLTVVTSAAQASTALGTCTAPSTVQGIRSAIGRGGREQVLDVGNLREVARDPDSRSIYCVGDIVTTRGSEREVAVRLFFGPSGAPLIELREGLESFADKRPVRLYLLDQLRSPRTDDDYLLKQLLLAAEQADREAQMTPEERAADEERKRQSRARMQKEAARREAQIQTLTVEPDDTEPGFKPN